MIELGAHWMHGEERNVVAHIAKSINEADKTITLTQTGKHFIIFHYCED